MKVSGIVNALALLQFPLMAQAKWDLTEYARHLSILEEKGTKYSVPNTASVKAPKVVVIAPKAASVIAPKEKAVKAPTAEAVKAPKSKRVNVPKTAKAPKAYKSNKLEPEEE